jgi:glucose/arabinose dehydrogenase
MRIPSSLAFISETQVLVGDREPGILRLIDVMSGEVVEIEGVPEMLRSGPVSSGLFDVKLARDFQSSRQLFLVYGIGTPEANGLAVSRFELSGKSLIKPKELFRSTTLIAGKWHFGGRLAVGSAHLYLSTGDGYDHKDLAQDPFHYAGKILRFNLDGGIPTEILLLTERKACRKSGPLACVTRRAWPSIHEQKPFTSMSMARKAAMKSILSGADKITAGP